MRRQLPEDSEHRTEPGSEDFDASEFSELIRSARAEQPNRSLKDTVVAAIAYRQALARPASSSWRSRAAWTAFGTALAVAAGVVVVLRNSNPHSNVKITPEPEPVASSKSSSSLAKVESVPIDPCVDKKTASGARPFIDDFEDGDDEVSLVEGRSGLWRWVRDTDAPGTSPALLPIPRPNAKPGNRLAIHAKGGKLLDWGAVIEFDFVPSCYDASVYRGLTFQAKGPGRIFVAPREVGVIPVALGGTCREDCHNAHVKKIDLDGQWRTYEVHWSEVAQRGYGKPALDPGRLNSLAFQIHPEDTPYDVWLDDVRFLSKP
jgi:hypothetical protein